MVNAIASYSSEIIDGNKTQQAEEATKALSYSSEIIDGNKTSLMNLLIELAVIF